MPRMRILNTAEQARFEHPPAFNSAEHKRYFDFSQSVMDAVQDLRSPANRIGFPPTRGCRTTPASCPQNLRSGSSRKTGSRQIGNSPTSSAQNEILYGGIGTYVRLGPMLKCAHDWGEWTEIMRRSLLCSSGVLAVST